MYELEKEARRQKVGLWSDGNAQEPWQWRREQNKPRARLTQWRISHD